MITALMGRHRNARLTNDQSRLLQAVVRAYMDGSRKLSSGRPWPYVCSGNGRACCTDRAALMALRRLSLVTIREWSCGGTRITVAYPTVSGAARCDKIVAPTRLTDYDCDEISRSVSTLSITGFYE